MRNSRRDGRVRPRSQAGKEGSGTNAPAAMLRGPSAGGAASYEWMTTMHFKSKQSVTARSSRAVAQPLCGQSRLVQVRYESARLPAAETRVGQGVLLGVIFVFVNTE
jgi:hypothetical protein